MIPFVPEPPVRPLDRSFLRIVPFAISRLFTWPSLMCLERTTLFVSTIAAYAPPPSARKTAIVAITFAYVVLRLSRASINSP